MAEKINYKKLETQEIGQTKELLEEYIDSLHLDLSFQDIQEEMTSFPDKYREPAGAFIIAKCGEIVCGCVGLKRINLDICEMKRLFVRDDFKGLGIGKRLIELILLEAKKKGYRKIRLDTLPSMKKAQDLYRYFGFYEIEPYVFNPVEGSIFFEREL